MRSVSVAAPAKLNLGLEVLRRRDDGYHDVKTVLQTVSIVDQLTVSESDCLEIDAPDLDVASEDNLALRAARLVTARLNVPPARIGVRKMIPAAAGLGGASSDAASTLRAICMLWQRSLSDATLAEIAAQLGSDVPFFLQGGTALATGRGEILTPLPRLPPVWFVVAAPDLTIPNKTAHMYNQLTPADFSDGATVDAVASAIAGGTMPDWAAMPNAFTRPLLKLQPRLEELRMTFRRAGAPFVTVTGAGPAQFTAVPDRDQADTIHAAVAAHFSPAIRVFVCTPLAASPHPMVVATS